METSRSAWPTRFGQALAAALGLAGCAAPASPPCPSLPTALASPLFAGEPRAFPGAEGAGAFARGGRGGDVYAVTTLADDGPGSLRFGIDSASGPRTVVFDVAGTIELASDLVIRRGHLTLAGQSAPGGGITLAGRQLRIEGADHVIVRHLRVRPGDRATRPLFYEPDAISVKRSHDVIVDHVSASWSTDEVVSVTHGSDRVTVQWSLIGEALHRSNHHKGNHGYGSLVRGGEIAFLHNLFAHNRSRNPRPGSDEAGRLRFSFVGNVIYNPGDAIGYAGDDDFEMDYVANTVIAGPDTWPGVRAPFLGGGARNRIHQRDNRIDLARSGPLQPSPAFWRDFDGLFLPSYRPLVSAEVTLADPAESFARVLAEAGASRWRDPVDVRLVESVKSRSGRHIDSQSEVGGWPPLPPGRPRTDTDRDGLPDAWERARCLDPDDPADAQADRNGDGATNLEEWLDERARGEAWDAAGDIVQRR